MSTHFGSLILYATLVSVVFAIITREGTRPRLQFAALLAGSMIALSVAIGWLMRLLA